MSTSDMVVLYPVFERKSNALKTKFGFDILADALSICESITDLVTSDASFFTLPILSEYCRMQNLKFLIFAEGSMPITGPFPWLTKYFPNDDFCVAINHRKFESTEELTAYCSSSVKKPHCSRKQDEKHQICARLTAQSDLEDCPFSYTSVLDADGYRPNSYPILAKGKPFQKIKPINSSGDSGMYIQQMQSV